MNNKIIIALLAIIVVVALVFVYGSSKASQLELTGEVTYRERIALPAGSVVEIKLQDVSRADTMAEVIAEQTITTTGENVPIPFSLKYDSRRIQDNATYSISARINVNGELRWVTTDHIPVLTNENPSSGLSIMLNGVSSQQGQGAGAVNINGTTFRLSSFNGTSIPVGQNYTLKFEGISLYAKFCNNMSGSFTMGASEIKAGALVSTLMYCENIMEFENAFATMMDTGATYSLVGSTLTIKDTKNTMVFTVFMD